MPSSGVQTCARSEEHTSELQSHDNLVCRLLLEKKTTLCPNRHTPLPTTDPRPISTHSRARPGAVLWAASGILQRRSAELRGGSGFFFFNDPAPTEISPLPPPGALPI